MNSDYTSRAKHLPYLRSASYLYIPEGQPVLGQPDLESPLRAFD